MKIDGDTQRYQGYFKDNKRTGFGCYTWAKGFMCSYFGEFMEGKRSGLGANLYANGDVFFGEMKDNSRV